MVERKELNDDGTVRRKYELDDEVQSKLFVRSAIWMAVAAGFVALKNALFSDDDAKAAQSRGASTADAGDGRVKGEAADGADTANSAAGEHISADDGSDAVGGAQSDSSLASPVADFAAPLASANSPDGASQQSGGSIPAPVNDNEALYGAAPGSAVSATIIDFPGGAWSAFAGAQSFDNVSFIRGDEPIEFDVGDVVDESDEDSDTEAAPRPLNRLPVVLGPVILTDLTMNGTIVIAIADLLRHAADPDGDALTINGLTAGSGQLQVLPGVGWRYTPEARDTSSVTFRYSISDGEGAVAQVAYLDLLPPTPADEATDQPTEPSDDAAQTPGDGAGDPDVVTGEDGADVILGTQSDDRISGTLAGDIIVAGDGNDIVHAGAGDDVVYGGAGDDEIHGETGDDALFGGDGDDLIDGGDGADYAAGDSGDDRLSGGGGGDVLDGGDGDDDLVGGGGDDVLIGGSGQDETAGGDGDDVFIATAGDGDDSHDGGAGTDTYDASSTSEDAVVNLESGIASSETIGVDRLSNIESVATGDGDDVIVGNDGYNGISAGAGNDVVIAAGGDDVVAAGDGDDVIVAEAGDGDDAYDGGDGVDTLDISSTTADALIDLAAGIADSDDIGDDAISGIENAVGGAGHDAITGSNAVNAIDGKAGDDRIAAAGGADVVQGGAGDDVIVATVGDGDDDYDGGDGDDVYDLSGTAADAVVDLTEGEATSAETGSDTLANIENVIGGAGEDQITGDSNANTIAAGAGADVVQGGAGDDVIVATVGDGDDVYDGGDGDDVYDLSGTTADAIIDLDRGYASSDDVGHDVISGIEGAIGGGGDDVIVAGEAPNVLVGGDGDDIFVFRSARSIGREPGSRDKILDFAVGDRIDLDDISKEFEKRVEEAFEDADIRKFVLISSAADFTRPGQIKFKYDNFEDRPVTILQGNIDFDGETEFELELGGYHEFNEYDFSSGRS